MIWKCSLEVSVMSGRSPKSMAGRAGARGAAFADALRASFGGAATPSGVEALSLRAFCSSGDKVGDLDLERDLEALLRSGLGAAQPSCFTT